MTVDEALRRRRSVKHFDPAHALDDGAVRALMEPVLFTPTSFNLQHFRFVVARDAQVKAQLAQAAYGQQQLAQCSAAVAILAKLPAHEDAERVWDGAPDGVRTSMARTIRAFYDGTPALQRDEAIRSGSMAAMALMLRATELALDTCPLIGFDDAAVRGVLGVPDDHVVVLLVCVGRATQPPHPRVGRYALEELVVLDGFQGASLQDPTS